MFATTKQEGLGQDNEGSAEEERRTLIPAILVMLGVTAFISDAAGTKLEKKPCALISEGSFSLKRIQAHLLKNCIPDLWAKSLVRRRE